MPNTTAITLIYKSIHKERFAGTLYPALNRSKRMFFFLKKNAVKTDFSFLGVDMHNHLLYGLDDGLQKPEQTIEFIKKLQKVGYEKLICTPHILSDVHPNSSATILSRLNDVRKLLADNEVDMKIEAAAEYMVDHEFAALAQSNAPILSFGNNYVLIEMSYVAPSPYLEESIFNLKLKNFQPVLAHPERYSYLHNNFNKYIDIKDRGCLLQLNLLSLTGYYGIEIKKVAGKLIEENMIDFVGTDIHHYNHLNAALDFACNSKMYQLLQRKDFLNATLL